jgi:hypothetical protein
MSALDTVHQIAERNSLMLDYEPGDIVYMNNMSIFHTRESFKNSGEGTGRHLLKLFLRDPQRQWRMPDSLNLMLDPMFGPNKPNGIRDEKWVMDYSKHTKRHDKIKWCTNG